LFGLSNSDRKSSRCRRREPAAYDLDAAEAITFATAAAPGLLEEFLVADSTGDGRRTTNAAGAS
jgi:hypothetical protein